MSENQSNDRDANGPIHEEELLSLVHLKSVRKVREHIKVVESILESGQSRFFVRKEKIKASQNPALYLE